MTAISNGGAAQRVKVLQASDLKANGGAYSLEGRIPIAVYGVVDAETTAQGGDYVVMGNVAQPVYVVDAPGGAIEATIAPTPMIAVDGLTMGNVAIPVYVVGGSLGGLDPVQNLALSITGAAFDTITAEWDAVDGATDYEIEYSPDGVTYTPVGTTALLTFDIEDTDYVLNVDTHYVRVRAVGGSDWTVAPIDDLLLYLVAGWLATRVSGNWADSIGSNDGVQNGTIGTVAGLFGTANRLESANNEYFLIASPTAELDVVSGDYSTVAWIRTLSNATFGLIFDKAYSGGTGGFYLDGLQSIMREFDSAGATGIDVAPNTWTQIAMVVDFDGDTITYYRNTNSNQQTWSNPTGTLNDVAIGGAANGSFTFDGDMNQLLVYKGRALTSGKIARLYGGGSGLDISTLL